MPFIAIDFETANEKRSSACQLGIASCDGEKIESRSWLIKPPELYFNGYNVAIHGITADDVADKPQLDELWSEIAPLLAGQTLIAHNASFDMSVLRRSLDAYDVPYPTLDYYCTRVFAKKAWPSLISYGLSAVADHLAVTFQHHDAEADAIMCAEVAMECCRKAGVQSLTELAEHHGICPGQLAPDGYKPCRASKGSGSEGSTLRVGDIQPASGEFNPDHPLCGETVVFTGTLQSMKRKDAMQKVVDCGGKVATVVGKTLSPLNQARPFPPGSDLAGWWLRASQRHRNSPRGSCPSLPTQRVPPCPS